MTDRENTACQHVLNCIELLKYTPVVPMIEAWIRLFPISLETYSAACSLLVPNPCRNLAMLWVHLMGEELKKKMPDHVSEIDRRMRPFATRLEERVVEAFGR